LLRRLTQPLHRLAERMRDYSAPRPAAPQPSASLVAERWDEVQAIGAAFDEMTQRIERRPRASSNRRARTAR
jgi:HAMP domain-containing protein